MARINETTTYLQNDPDWRSGKPRWYYRRAPIKRIRIKAATPIGTPAFDRAFYAAEKEWQQLANDKAAGVVTPRAMVVCKPTSNPDYVKRFGDTAEPGVVNTLRWLVDQFEASPKMQSASKHTRDCYMINLRRVVAMRTADGSSAYGEWPLDGIEQQHIEGIQQKLKDMPATADNTVKNLRTLFYWGKAQKPKLFEGDNPAVGINWLHPYDDDNDGWPMWEVADWQKFQRVFPIDHPAMMCAGLIMYAGCRIVDAGMLGPFNEKRGHTELHWTETKGKGSTVLGRHRPTAKARELIIEPELRQIIDAQRHKGATFVLQPNGERYTRGSIQKRFKDWCLEAGLGANLSAHGLRKLAAALMYESGTNEAQLCAIFGWKIGSRMAAWYAKKFDKRASQRTGFAALRSSLARATKAA